MAVVQHQDPVGCKMCWCDQTRLGRSVTKRRRWRWKAGQSLRKQPKQVSLKGQENPHHYWGQYLIQYLLENSRHAFKYILDDEPENDDSQGPQQSVWSSMPKYNQAELDPEKDIRRSRVEKNETANGSCDDLQRLARRSSSRK